MIKIYSFYDSLRHYEKPAKEFEKRLGKSVELIKLKPSKRKTSSEQIDEETDQMLKILEKTKGYKILLSIGGKMMSSEDFADFIEQKSMHSGDIVFIIGGAYGLDESRIIEYIDYKFSFSPMTFPHAQAIMMLLEQLYRAQSIKVGRNYHH